jgi:hypothetical protein
MGKSSDSDNGGDEDYKIGYGRPPRHSQWKKGQSGYLPGRPKGAIGIKTKIKKRLLASVKVRENGKVRSMTMLEAMVVKAMNEAVLGRPKPFIDVFKLLNAAKLFSLDELEEPTSHVAAAKQVTIQIIRPNPRPGDPNYLAAKSEDSSQRGLLPGRGPSRKDK